MASSTASHVTVSPAEAGQYWWHFRVPFSITLCKDFWYTDSQSTILSRNTVTPCYSGKASFAAMLTCWAWSLLDFFVATPCSRSGQSWPGKNVGSSEIKFMELRWMGHLEGSLGEYVRPVDGIDCEKWRIDIVRVDHLKELVWRKMSNKRPYSRRWNNFRWGTTSTRGTRLWS